MVRVSWHFLRATATRKMKRRVSLDRNRQRFLFDYFPWWGFVLHAVTMALVIAPLVLRSSGPLLLGLYVSAHGFLSPQFATFFFPSGKCSGSGSSSTIEGLYTLPAFGCAGQSQRDRQEVVVRTWTITSVYENSNPLEVTIQAKVNFLHRALVIFHLSLVICQLSRYSSTVCNKDLSGSSGKWQAAGSTTNR